MFIFCLLLSNSLFASSIYDAISPQSSISIITNEHIFDNLSNFVNWFKKYQFHLNSPHLFTETLRRQFILDPLVSPILQLSKPSVQDYHNLNIPVEIGQNLSLLRSEFTNVVNAMNFPYHIWNDPRVFNCDDYVDREYAEQSKLNSDFLNFINRSDEENYELLRQKIVDGCKPPDRTRYIQGEYYDYLDVEIYPHEFIYDQCPLSDTPILKPAWEMTSRRIISRHVNLMDSILSWNFGMDSDGILSKYIDHEYRLKTTICDNILAYIRFEKLHILENLFFIFSALLENIYCLSFLLVDSKISINFMRTIYFFLSDYIQFSPLKIESNRAHIDTEYSEYFVIGQWLFRQLLFTQLNIYNKDLSENFNYIIEGKNKDSDFFFFTIEPIVSDIEINLYELYIWPRLWNSSNTGISYGGPQGELGISNWSFISKHVFSEIVKLDNLRVNNILSSGKVYNISGPQHNRKIDPEKGLEEYIWKEDYFDKWGELSKIFNIQDLDYPEHDYYKTTSQITRKIPLEEAIGKSATHDSQLENIPHSQLVSHWAIKRFLHLYEKRIHDKLHDKFINIKTTKITGFSKKEIDRESNGLIAHYNLPADQFIRIVKIRKKQLNKISKSIDFSDPDDFSRSIYQCVEDDIPEFADYFNLVEYSLEISKTLFLPIYELYENAILVNVSKEEISQIFLKIIYPKIMRLWQSYYRQIKDILNWYLENAILPLTMAFSSDIYKNFFALFYYYNKYDFALFELTFTLHSNWDRINFSENLSRNLSMIPSEDGISRDLFNMFYFQMEGLSMDTRRLLPKKLLYSIPLYGEYIKPPIENKDDISDEENLGIFSGLKKGIKKVLTISDPLEHLFKKTNKHGYNLSGKPSVDPFENDKELELLPLLKNRTKFIKTLLPNHLDVEIRNLRKTPGDIDIAEKKVHKILKEHSESNISLLNWSFLKREFEENQSYFAEYIVSGDFTFDSTGTPILRNEWIYRSIYYFQHILEPLLFYERFTGRRPISNFQRLKNYGPYQFYKHVPSEYQFPINNWDNHIGKHSLFEPSREIYGENLKISKDYKFSIYDKIINVENEHYLNIYSGKYLSIGSAIHLTRGYIFNLLNSNLFTPFLLLYRSDLSHLINVSSSYVEPGDNAQQISREVINFLSDLFSENPEDITMKLGGEPTIFEYSDEDDTGVVNPTNSVLRGLIPGAEWPDWLVDDFVENLTNARSIFIGEIDSRDTHRETRHSLYRGQKEGGKFMKKGDEKIIKKEDDKLMKEGDKKYIQEDEECQMHKIPEKSQLLREGDFSSIMSQSFRATAMKNPAMFSHFYTNPMLANFGKSSSDSSIQSSTSLDQKKDDLLSNDESPEIFNNPLKIEQGEIPVESQLSRAFQSILRNSSTSQFAQVYSRIKGSLDFEKQKEHFTVKRVKNRLVQKTESKTKITTSFYRQAYLSRIIDYYLINDFYGIRPFLSEKSYPFHSTGISTNIDGPMETSIFTPTSLDYINFFYNDASIDVFDRNALEDLTYHILSPPFSRQKMEEYEYLFYMSPSPSLLNAIFLYRAKRSEFLDPGDVCIRYSLPRNPIFRAGDTGTHNAVSFYALLLARKQIGQVDWAKYQIE